jgi:hypothetical protein
MSAARELLERYVDAKDGNRPELTPDLYLPDAVLTYSIATDEIDFPRHVAGRDAVTRTLVTDFGQRFDCCKTYYICESPPRDDIDIPSLPWLVVMCERATAQLRVGRGTYRWQFASAPGAGLRVRAMHIHIERMAAIADAGVTQLQAIQRDLPYPWLAPTALRGRLDQLARQNASMAWLRPFREPASGPQ